MIMSKKRTREDRFSEDRDERVTKKLKSKHNMHISNLPTELITQILVQVPKDFLASVTEVSKQWLQIVQTREFWKLSCHEKWLSVVASDSLDYDKDEYEVPTVNMDGKILVNWRLYFTIRTKFQQLAFRVINLPKFGLFYNSAIEALCTQICACSDLNCDRIGQLVRHFGLTPALPPDLIANHFDFSLDLIDMWWQRNELQLVKPAINSCHHLLSICKYLMFKQFRICRRYYDMCQRVIDANLPAALVDADLRLFQSTHMAFFSLPVIDDRAQRLFKLIIESTVQFLAMSSDRLDPQTKSPGPTPGTVVVLHGPLANHKGLLDMLIQVTRHMYDNNSDWKTQLSALYVAWVYKSTNQDYWHQLIDFALTAAGHIDAKVSFAAIMLLMQEVSAKENQLELTDEQSAKIFEVLTAAFKLNVNKYGLCLTLTKLLPNIKPELISDAVLDEFVTQMFTAAPYFIEDEKKVVYQFDKIGAVFKHRLSGKLDFVRQVLFDMTKLTTFDPVRLLACYVNFSYHVKGAEFADEFKRLAIQITEGTLPFTVSVFSSYEHFGSIWIKFAESNEQCVKIIETLLAAIPKDVFEYAQSNKLPKENFDDDKDDLPETLKELVEDHTHDITQLADWVHSVPLRANHATTFTVAKQYLKPLLTVTKRFNKTQLVADVSAAYHKIKQLARIVTQSNGQYMQYTQDVLHAMLALNLGAPQSDVKEWYQMLSELIVAVKEQIDPNDMIKYCTRLFHDIVVDATPPTGEKIIYPKGLADLFALALDSLLELQMPVSTAVMVKVVKCFMQLYEVKVPLSINVSEFVGLIALACPQSAKNGLVHAEFGIWLSSTCSTVASKVTTAEFDSHQLMDRMAPYLCAYARYIALYGVASALKQVWVHNTSFAMQCMVLMKYLYAAVNNGTVTMDKQDEMFLRIGVVLQALSSVMPSLDALGIIPKVDSSLLDTVKVAVNSDCFYTGSDELTNHIKSLSVEDICKLLLLNITYE